MSIETYYLLPEHGICHFEEKVPHPLYRIEVRVIGGFEEAIVFLECGNPELKSFGEHFVVARERVQRGKISFESHSFSCFTRAVNVGGCAVVEINFKKRSANFSLLHGRGVGAVGSFVLRKWSFESSIDHMFSVQRLISAAASQRDGLIFSRKNGFMETHIDSRPILPEIPDGDSFARKQVKLLIEASKSYLMTLHFLVENAVKVVEQFHGHDAGKELLRIKMDFGDERLNDAVNYLSHFCMGGRYDDVEGREPVIPNSFGGNLSGLKFSDLDAESEDDVFVLLDEVTRMSAEIVGSCARSLIYRVPFDPVFRNSSQAALDWMARMTLGIEQLKSARNGGLLRYLIKKEVRAQKACEEGRFLVKAVRFAKLVRAYLAWKLR